MTQLRANERNKFKFKLSIETARLERSFTSTKLWYFIAQPKCSYLHNQIKETRINNFPFLLNINSKVLIKHETRNNKLNSQCHLCANLTCRIFIILLYFIHTTSHVWVRYNKKAHHSLMAFFPYIARLTINLFCLYNTHRFEYIQFTIWIIRVYANIHSETCFFITCSAVKNGVV